MGKIEGEKAATVRDRGRDRERNGDVGSYPRCIYRHKCNERKCGKGLASSVYLVEGNLISSEVQQDPDQLYAEPEIDLNSLASCSTCKPY